MPQGLSAALPSVSGRTTRTKSLYTAEEIARVLDSIDRTDAIGKHDYAMILLGASVAPRALDVIRLKVDDIDWARLKMSFVSHKKKHLHTAALVPALGNAILDYLLSGRPDSESPCLFVTSRPPHSGFASSSSCASILRKRIGRAGVNPTRRATGFHAFRTYGASTAILEDVQPGLSEAEDDLVASGLLDSLAIVNVVAELEDVFGIELEPEDIVPENFHTVDDMVRLVSHYKAG
ncbi:MAG: phosphopantetheine-binding protein [Coriobacteriales bacterium]|nr:phosphopantetheine-binding protein [Coriobacteriales bacterium]